MFQALGGRVSLAGSRLLPNLPSSGFLSLTLLPEPVPRRSLHPCMSRVKMEAFHCVT